MARIRCIVLHVDGTRTERTFDGLDPPLPWMQEQVGGWIEMVGGLLPLRVYVNEDGLLKNLPVNEQAFERFGDVKGTVDGKLLGNVVVVESIN